MSGLRLVGLRGLAGMMSTTPAADVAVSQCFDTQSAAFLDTVPVNVARAAFFPIPSDGLDADRRARSVRASMSSLRNGAGPAPGAAADKVSECAASEFVRALSGVQRESREPVLRVASAFAEEAPSFVRLAMSFALDAGEDDAFLEMYELTRTGTVPGFAMPRVSALAVIGKALDRDGGERLADVVQAIGPALVLSALVRSDSVDAVRRLAPFFSSRSRDRREGTGTGTRRAAITSSRFESWIARHAPSRADELRAAFLGP